MPLVASKISRFTMEETRVVSLGSIRIQAIYISNPTGSVVEIALRDNNEIPLLNMTCPATDSESLIVPWIADNGLEIISVGDSNVVVTVIHTSEGA